MATLGQDAPHARATLSGAWYSATIRGADFSGAALASISGSRLLSLVRCSFAGADMRQSTLDDWHFKLCDLRGADLRGASLRGAHFAGCDLTGADLRDTDLFEVVFGDVGVGKGAIPTCLDGARFSPER